MLSNSGNVSLTHGQGDGVCDTTHGDGINAEHLAYPGDANTQKMGTDFVVKQLKGQ